MLFKKYIITLSALLSVFFVILCGNIVFLYRSDELKDLSTIVAEQISENKIANLAKLSLLEYKIETYSQIKPEIIIIGSSTAMRFKQSMFTVPSYNLGGAGWGPYESAYVLEKVLNIHKPKVVLFSQDLFTLCDTANEIGQDVHVPRRVTGRHAINKGYENSFFIAFDLYLKGRITIAEYAKTLFSNFTISDFQSHFLGVFGKLSFKGLAKDGSLVNVSSKIDASKLPIKAANDGHFEICENSKFRFNMMKFLISRVQNMGINIIGLLPPLAPSLYNEVFDSSSKISTKNILLREQYKEFRFRSSKVGFDEFFDFTNPKSVRTFNCEFIDNIHFGDVVAAKILDKMNTEKSNLILSITNAEILVSMIKETWGFNSIIRDDYLAPFYSLLMDQRNGSAKCLS